VLPVMERDDAQAGKAGVDDAIHSSFLFDNV
jgi:hypothetical protein